MPTRKPRRLAVLVGIFRFVIRVTVNAFSTATFRIQRLMFLTALGTFVSLIAFSGVATAQRQVLTVNSLHLKGMKCRDPRPYAVTILPSEGINRRCVKMGAKSFEQKEDYSTAGLDMMHYLRNNMKLAGSGLTVYAIEWSIAGKIYFSDAYRADLVADSPEKAICEVSPPRKTYRVPGTDILVQLRFESDDISCKKPFIYQDDIYVNKTSRIVGSAGVYTCHAIEVTL